MTAETTTISLDVIDAALAAAVPGLGEDDQRLAVAVLRLLAAGQPVSVPAVAEAAGLPGPRAEQALRSWPAVFRDARGQVAGFAGLALAQMAAPPAARRDRSVCLVRVGPAVPRPGHRRPGCRHRRSGHVRGHQQPRQQ